MSKSLHIIKEIIDLLDKYLEEKENAPANLKEFVLWVNEFMFEQSHYNENGANDDNLNMELTYLLIIQNKYFKAYTKKVLINSKITTSEEYSFLYHLSLVDSYRKMEIINMHMLEGPSGIEIIKRLLKKRLIDEFDDDKDKRAKRVRITEEGRKEIRKIIPKMQKVYSDMAANMGLNEKLHIISFLRRFNDFHEKNEFKQIISRI
ncbi:MAG: winged helix DNA-binding protein [Mariniphaga sp.]|nr:winged helix DNA-binding protein [Mariniphaga sp.]